MRRIEKEILKAEQVDLGMACWLAKKSGYEIEVYDGDGENGMCEPSLSFNRIPNHIN